MIENNAKINKEPDFRQVDINYKEWIKQVTIIPTSFYFVSIIINMGLVVIFVTRHDIHVWFWISVCFFMLSYAQIIKREGHKEGYFDGYAEGYSFGRDDALGIDPEERQFVDIESKT